MKTPIITKKPFYLLLLLTTLLLYSCHKDDTTVAQKEDYIAYNTFINKAETNILDSLYAVAIKNYDTAFSYVQKPVARHCFTAAQVAANQNDLTHFKTYITTGVKIGLLPEYYTADSLLNGYIQEHQLMGFLNGEYNQYHATYEKSLKIFLKDTLAKISAEDMKWKRPYLDSLPYVHPENVDTYNRIYDSIITHLVENKLFPIIQQYGYPDERLIGFYKKGSREDNYSFYNSQAYVLLLHYYTFPRDCRYNNILLEEVKKGNLQPNQFATFIDFQARLEDNGLCKVDYYNEHYSTQDTTQFTAINKRRAAIGLGTFQDKRRKFKRGQKVCKERRVHNHYKHIRLFYWCG